MEEWQRPWVERRTLAGGIPPIDRPEDHRDPFDRDRARIIHSAAFRRLQSKTQVLGIGEGDFRRTRLTHSMEVAQIAKGIVGQLRKNDFQTQSNNSFLDIIPSNDLIEAIGLTHDLGHPPFGHSGEIALNFRMRDNGGFEGNAQTLRLLARLESYQREFGLDLTRRTLFGILKYPVPYSVVRKKELPQPPDNPTLISVEDWKPPKCYFDEETDIFNWLCEPFNASDKKRISSLSKKPLKQTNGKSKYKLLDTSILDLADDIAYCTHDLEDGIALKLISKSVWERHWRSFKKGRSIKAWMDQFGLGDITSGLFDSQSDGRKRAIGALAHCLICSVEVSSVQEFHHDLLHYNVSVSGPAKKLKDMLLSITSDNMIKIQQVQTSEFRGRHLVLHVFDALSNNPERMLKEGYFREQYKESPSNLQMRVVCDYVAGMTDEFATKFYERLYVPRQGSVFDRL